MSKAIDVSIHCAMRYDRLAEQRQAILEEKDSDVRAEMLRSYLTRYWVFIGDQFDLWLFGVLDHDTFFDMLCNLAARIVRERCKPESKTGGLESAWTNVEPPGINIRPIANPQFNILVVKLLAITAKCPSPPTEKDLVEMAQRILEMMRELQDNFADQWRWRVQEGLRFDHYTYQTERELRDLPTEWKQSDPVGFWYLVIRTRRMWMDFIEDRRSRRGRSSKNELPKDPPPKD